MAAIDVNTKRQAVYLTKAIEVYADYLMAAIEKDEKLAGYQKQRAKIYVQALRQVLERRAIAAMEEICNDQEQNTDGDHRPDATVHRDGDSEARRYPATVPPPP